MIEHFIENSWKFLVLVTLFKISQKNFNSFKLITSLAS